jgi:hypothetical protein
MLEAHPETVYRLLSSIPRFETVAEMIKRQHMSQDDDRCGEAVQMGAQMLRIAIHIDRSGYFLVIHKVACIIQIIAWDRPSEVAD